jgi:iron complex outermembrane receptor protein
MYYQSPVEQGNPELDPEESLGYELGIRNLTPWMLAEVNIFHQNARELIDWVGISHSDSTLVWTALNFSQVKRSGIEIACELNMGKILDIRNLISNLQIGYNYITSDLKEKGLMSRYILENLKHQLILGINHKIIWKIYFNFKARFNQRENAPSYWVLDSRLFWSDSKDSLIFFEATNLLDSQYSEVITPMPGRWIRAGFSYKFKFK